MLPESQPDTAHPWGDGGTPYEELGGEEVLRKLVNHFYDRMDVDSPVLRAMHPADDSNSRRNLYEFLSGWLGGPPLYLERKGHPKLRMRHFPFTIGVAEAEEWMRSMRGAFDDINLAEPLRSYLDAKLEQTAHHVRNA
jgi:hemoglobin